MSSKKPLPGQMFLGFNLNDKTRWFPPSELPTLDGVRELTMDQETTGKNKFKDKIVGTAIRTDTGLKFYLPKGHAGGNIDPEKIARWKRQELRNKKIINVNVGYDAEIERNDGIDLEAQCCTLHDIAHSAALLNENRFGGYNLDDLGVEYCARQKRDDKLDKSRMADYHSSMVAEYAMDDADLAWDIYQAQKPLIAKENLDKVEALEDALIWAVNHIERNGARLDVDKMHRDTTALVDDLAARTMSIWGKTGVRLDPNLTNSWDKIFLACGLEPHKVVSKKSKEVTSSYTDDYLKKIKNDIVQEGLMCRRLMSIKSRYMDRYERERRGDFLPFSLYQLRANEEDNGTVVGRFAAANVPIQQIYKVANQVRKFGATGYIIREWIVPDDGYEMFTCDGSQLQFRLFAHLSQDPQLIKAYHEGYNIWMAGGKDVDFHQMVADLFGMNRDIAKNQNFGLVMGLGRQHLSEWLGLGCNCHSEEYWKFVEGRSFDASKSFGNNDNHGVDCPARQANDLCDEYKRRFPAGEKTMDYVVKFAKKNGFVPTLLGRRRHYEEYEVRNGLRQKTRFYKALASWLQGSEADIVKTKLLRIYKERNTLGIWKLRMPMHDELTGDKDPDPKYNKLLKEAFNIQEIPCRVPITWQFETGKNWRACSGK